MRLLRAAGALAVLAVVVAGFPALMLAVVGSPIPKPLPRLDEIIGTLTTRDDGTLFIGVLELAAWGAWAVFSLSVAWEIASRARGLRTAPRLPLVGGFQRLAAYLITAVTVAVGVPVAATAAPPAPPVVAMAPQHPLGEAPKDQIYRVRHGDTLWGIADKKLGDARRWPKIWKLNAHSTQPAGQRFSDPDLIRPGWKLRLPIKPVPQEAVQEQPQVVEPPPVAPPAERQPATEVIELPSGSLVALAYAAGVSTAFAMKRLLNRRRRALPGPSERVTVQPEATPEPVVQELRRAYRQSFAALDAEPASEDELLGEASSIDVPPRIKIGRRDDGSPVEVDLSGPGLGLCGEGSDDVLRYLIVDLLRQSSDFRTELIIHKDLAEALLAELPAIPGLVVADTKAEALRRFNDTHFTRCRMLLEREASSVEELRVRDPGEILPAVLLVTDLDDEVNKWITAPLTSGRETGVFALVQGERQGGTTCFIDDDHYVTRVRGRLAEALDAAQLFHITQEEAAAALRALAPAREPVAPLPPVSSAAWSGPELVRLSILGPPTVLIRDQPHPLELSWLQLSLLAYLALHRTGVTRDQLTTALWPDETGKDIHNALRHLRAALVTATGYVNPDSKRAPFINASTTKDSATYRIDPQLISVDLWEYQKALEQIGSEPSALTQAAALCNGELACGLETEWIEDHRYPLTRSQADVLSQLAHQYTDDEPERALDALERARELDPDTEEIYLRIISLQLRLGRRDDAQRAAILLRQRVSALGLAVSPRTERNLRALFDPSGGA